jgi:hypothetical protein
MKDDEILFIEGNPIQFCGAVLSALSDTYEEIYKRAGIEEGGFIEDVFQEIWRNGNTGEQYEVETVKRHGQPDDENFNGLLQAGVTACAYAAQGIKAEKSGDMLRAWQHTTRATYYQGVFVASWNLLKNLNNPAVTFAKIGVIARHKENRAMKEQVLEWWKKNAGEVRSKDAAAEQIAGKVVPVSFRTVRDWLKGLDKP